MPFRIYKIPDNKYKGYATYTVIKPRKKFEITDADFPYPLEFEILEKIIGIDVNKFELLKSG